MSKLIQITMLLLAFAAQSVTAVSFHCRMDMTAEVEAQTDMHAMMGHDMSNDTSQHGQTDSKSMDCCESLADCSMGACSSPALGSTVEILISPVSSSLDPQERELAIIKSPTNLYRPPILTC